MGYVWPEKLETECDCMAFAHGVIWLSSSFHMCKKTWCAPTAPALTSKSPAVASSRPDPDEAATARAFEVIRGRVAFYGSTPGYWGVLELHGLGDLGRELNVMSKQGKWAEMATRVSDDVVHLFTAVGTHREIAKRIEGRFGGLTDAVNMCTGEVNTQRSTIPSEPTSEQGIPPDLLQDIKRIPTPFRGDNTAW